MPVKLTSKREEKEAWNCENKQKREEKNKNKIKHIEKREERKKNSERRSKKCSSVKKEIFRNYIKRRIVSLYQQIITLQLHQ